MEKHKVISGKGEKKKKVNFGWFWSETYDNFSSCAYGLPSLSFKQAPWALSRNVINILVSVNIFTLLLGYVVEYGQKR